MTTSKKKSNNQIWTFVALFEGTGNDDGNKSIISKINDAMDKGQQNIFVSKVDGSGTHGGTFWKWLCGWNGMDWPVIVGRIYKEFYDKIREENINISQIDFYVFGFSRGAYQAKVFCNAIDKFGFKSRSWVLILKTFLYCLFPRKREQVYERPSIKLLGLFDAVCATWVRPIGLCNPGIPDCVEQCRHAVAANEYRKRFEPQLLSRKHSGDNFEEQMFVGCHSDIGWAYDRTSEFDFVEKFLSDSFGEGPNQASTKTLGRYAYSWVVGDVATKLEIEPTIKFSDKMSALMCVGLLCSSIFLPHDSYKDFTNFNAKTRQRKLVGIQPCQLIQSFRRLLDLNILDKIKLNVVKIVGQKPQTGSEKEMVATEYLKLYFSPNGSEVWMPTCIVNANQDETQALFHSLFCAFKDIRMLWKVLRSGGEIENSWDDELLAMTKFLMVTKGPDYVTKLVKDRMNFWALVFGARVTGPIGGTPR